MKILSFDYKDLAGNETHRTVITLSEPNPNYMTLDVSEISITDQTLALEELQIAYEEYKKVQAQILDTYAILKYRSFKPERMTNMVS